MWLEVASGFLKAMEKKRAGRYLIYNTKSKVQVARCRGLDEV